MFLQLILQVSWIAVALVVRHLKLLIDPTLCLMIEGVGISQLMRYLRVTIIFR